MNVNRCIPPIFHCDLCVNHIGWICALNHQCHKTDWIYSQLVLHRKESTHPLASVDHGRRRWKNGGSSITMQQDDESTQTKSDQVMKDINEPNFE
jgi:hypothetical protein